MNPNKEIIRTSLFHEKPWYQKESHSFISTVLSITADILQYLPTKIRKPFVKKIDELGLFFIRLLRIIPFQTQPFHLIQGRGEDDQTITILYQGDLSSFTFFIKKIFPHKQPTITTIHSSQQNKKKIHTIKKQAQIHIIEKDYFFKGFYQKKGYIIIPENITFILPIDKPVEDILKHCSQSIQEDVKKAKSYNYHYELKQDIQSYKLFYDTMYLPYAKYKYENMEKIISYQAMRHYALRGSQLLLITLQNTPIFGGIFDRDKHRIITQYAGLKQGKFNHIKNGIITLSYYYLITIAKQQNIKTIDFGTSPPFLSDGLYKYKRKWKMNITETKPIFSTIFAMKITKPTRNIQDIFQKNPIFHYKNNTLSPIFLIEKNEDYQKMKQEIIQQNHLKGINPTIYHSIEDLAQQNNSTKHEKRLKNG